nr:hypothetical protein [Altericroceibacterium spongiae]
MTVARVSLNQAKVNQVIHTLREGGPACAGRSQQRRLPSGDA